MASSLGSHSLTKCIFRASLSPSHLPSMPLSPSPASDDSRSVKCFLVSQHPCFPFAEADVSGSLLPAAVKTSHAISRKTLCCFVPQQLGLAVVAGTALLPDSPEHSQCREVLLSILQSHPSSSQMQRVCTGCSHLEVPHLRCMRTGKQSKVSGCWFVSLVKGMCKGIVL